MKIVMHGPLAGYGPDGTIHSWGPDTLVELDDGDAKQVAWGKAWLGMGATLVEDAKTAKAKEPARPARSEPARSEPAKPEPAAGPTKGK